MNIARIQKNINITKDSKKLILSAPSILILGLYAVMASIMAALIMMKICKNQLIAVTNIYMPPATVSISINASSL